MRRVFWWVIAAFVLPTSAACAVTFNCDNVGCLIDAIAAANTTAEPDVIELSPRSYILGVPATTDLPFGPTGLPIVYTPIKIRGNGATIQRAGYGCQLSGQPTPMPFRLFAVGCRDSSASSCGELALEDLTLSGGCALNPYPPGNPYNDIGLGGAICNVSGRLELTRVVLLQNKADYGGAIASRSGTMNATATTVVNNVARHSGGGIGLTKSRGEFLNTTLQKNYSYGRAGGLMQYGESNVNFVGGQILDNNAEDSGGGAVVDYLGTLSISRSEIRDNGTVGHWGAGIHVTTFGRIDISDTTIRGNSCPRCSGGGLALTNADLSVITRSTIYANTALTGGGVFLENHSAPGDRRLVVSNSTFGLNVAEQGGGIHLSAAAGTTRLLAELRHATFASNFAYRNGDALAITGGPISLTNTLVANAPFSAATACFDGTGTSVFSWGGNLGDDASCRLTHPSDLMGVHTGLLPYAETGLPGGGHYPLRVGSPAIDAATCTSLLTDQLGRARVGRCDIGAVEFRP